MEVLVNAIIPIFNFAAGLTGILLNLYIVAVYFRDWNRGSRLNLSDKILVIIAWNNIFLQCGLHVNLFLIMFFPALYQKFVTFSILSGFLICQILFNICITSCLCVYYCLSIITLKHFLIIRMKHRISEVISSLLLVSAVGSLTISVLVIWNVHVESINEITNSTSTLYLGNLKIYFNPIYSCLIIICCFCMPFSLAFLSISLTLRSLWTHAWNIRQSSSSFRIPSVDTHLRAAKIMIKLILLFAFFCTCQIILLSSSWTVQTFLDVVSCILTLMYPSAQTWILILGKSKLQSGFLKVYHYSLQMITCAKSMRT